MAPLFIALLARTGDFETIQPVAQAAISLTAMLGFSKQHRNADKPPASHTATALFVECLAIRVSACSATFLKNACERLICS